MVAQGRVELPTRGFSDRKQVDVFTPEQIEEVLEHAEPKIRMLVMIIAASGMRRGEALHLQWVDVVSDVNYSCLPATTISASSCPL
jgi:integrase